MRQRRGQRDEQGDASTFGTSRGRLFRTRFIAVCAEHLSDVDAIADLAERPDNYFQSLFVELGLPPPHPWFIEFCLRYIATEIDGLVPQAGSKIKMGAMFDS